jgi:hypothetical protein
MEGYGTDIMGGDFNFDIEGSSEHEGLFGHSDYSLPQFVVLLIVVIMALIIYTIMFTDVPGAESARNFVGIKKMHRPI